MSDRGPSTVIHLERMPAIDGLRAVAVYLVVAFHAGVERVEGGFVGVDVFFVLSGFLITRLLIVEYARSGRLDIVGFYARRARRLLPAAWVTVLLVSVVFVAFSNPAERASALDDARAAVLYFANWHFISSGQDYFAESIASSPFLHLWSLAVEEQFYLVWPVLSLVLLGRWRRAPRAVTGFVVGATVVASWWAVSVADGDLLRAYYATDTRAYQLLGGATIAFLLSRPDGSARRFLRQRTSSGLVAAGVAALGVIATVDVGNAVVRGMLAAAATAALVVAIAGREAGPAGSPERVLASPPFVVLGGLSYATYLWHWPLVILLERTLVLGTGSTLVVVTIASTALAKLSMDLVEQPIRRGSSRATRRTNVGAVGVGLAGTLVIGVLVVPAILRADVDQVRAAERAGFVPPPVTVTVPVEVPAAGEEAAAPAGGGDPSADDDADTTEPADATDPTDEAPVTVPPPPAIPSSGPVPVGFGAVPVETLFGERDGCVNIVPVTIEECVVVEGDGLRVMLIGDSHGSKLNIAFAEHAAANGYAYAVATTNGCAWQRTLRYRDALPIEGAKQACHDLRDVLYDEFVEAFAPDVIVAVSHDFVASGYAVEPRPGAPSTEGLEGDELIRIATTEAADELTAFGAELVIVEPIPRAPFHVADCLTGVEVVEACQFVVTDWPTSDTFVYREIAAVRDEVRTVDITRLACPAFPVCDAVIDGIQVREDRDHLYVAYTLRILDDLMALVEI